jgi:hypothetical protein
LKSWVDDIRRFVDFEKDLKLSLPPATVLEPWQEVDVSPYSLISTYYDKEAGIRWANKQKQTIVDQARTLIAGGWHGWKEVRVERKVVQLVPVAKEEVPPPKEVVVPAVAAASAKTETQRSAQQEEEDGWAFDDWNTSGQSTSVIPLQSDPPRPAVTSDPSPKSSEESGWSFDDDLNIGAKADSPPRPIMSAKPVRQARKIGKAKGKAIKESEASTPTTEELLAPSNVGSSTTSLVAPEDSWPEMPVNETPIQAAAGFGTGATHVIADPMPQTESCAVSQACSSLLAFIEEALQISQLSGLAE